MSVPLIFQIFDEGKVHFRTFQFLIIEEYYNGVNERLLADRFFLLSSNL